MTPTTLPTELWLFYPANDAGGAIRQARKSIRNECHDRGWSLIERATKRIRIDGRPLDHIEPQDAVHLYQRIHRARVGVCQFGEADICTIPGNKPQPKDFMRLRKFICNKAFHVRIPPDKFDETWEESLVDFQAWRTTVCCENEGDPRCLPFHLFSTSFNLDDLITAAGRERFTDQHGRQSRRSDDAKLVWQRPGDFHGYDDLQVAGQRLAKGFHWDVSPDRSERLITSPTEIWRIQRQGYINIYPDAYIRGTSGAHRIYPVGKKRKAH